MNKRIHKRMLELCGAEENMPDAYITFGPKPVMNAKELTVIVSGIEKAPIVKAVLEGPVTPDIQASILQLHPNATFILDGYAASCLTFKSNFIEVKSKF